MSKSNPMWGGRFDCSPNKIMEDINASISFDKRLAEQDILASKSSLFDACKAENHF